MKLPGTIIEVEKLDKESAGIMLRTAFAGGGLMLSQICSLTGIELYTVQNWVKRGFVSPPVGKRYTERQFCRLVIINMLRDCMPIGDITSLLSYINGSLSDEGDDTVSDDNLYLYLVSLLARTDSISEEEVCEAAREIAAGSDCTDRNKLEKVLPVMYFAYRSALLSRKKDLLFSSLTK